MPRLSSDEVRETAIMISCHLATVTSFITRLAITQYDDPRELEAIIAAAEVSNRDAFTQTNMLLAEFRLQLAERIHNARQQQPSE